MYIRRRRGESHLPIRFLLAVAVFGAFGLGSAASAEAAPTLSVSDVSINEPDTQNENVTFTVSLSEPSPTRVTVDFATANGTAVFGSQSQGDYFRRLPSTLSFGAGETQKTVAVTVLPDARDEFDENFHLDLSNASGGATISDARGTATIVDDDAAPTLSVADVTTTEPGVDTLVGFTVSLSAPSGKTVTVSYATANVTAAFAKDYHRRLPATLTFAPGETTLTVPVWILPDALDEFDETFQFNLSNASSASIADAQAIGTIQDDTDAPPTISVNDRALTEPASDTLAPFTVSLSAPSGKPVKVDFATANGTAAFAKDYHRRLPTTLTIDPGATSRAVNVWILPDALDEFDETFHFDLTNPVNASISDSRGTATIADDADAPPTVSVGDLTTTEPSSGSITASVPVRLSAPSGKTITVQFSTANGTATNGQDYTGKTNHTVTIAPGFNSIVTGIPILSDNFREGAETINTSIASPVNATMGDGSGVVTIGSNCYDREPNSFATALGLGSIAGDLGSASVSSAAGASICAGEEDWYKVEIREDNEDDGFLSATVRLNVADGASNGDLELFVYDDDGSFWDSSENGGTTDECVYWHLDDTVATETRFIYIAIVGFPDPVTGRSAANDYTLTVTGNQLPPGCP